MDYVSPDGRSACRSWPGITARVRILAAVNLKIGSTAVYPFPGDTIADYDQRPAGVDEVRWSPPSSKRSPRRQRGGGWVRLPCTPANFPGMRAQVGFFSPTTLGAVPTAPGLLSTESPTPPVKQRARKSPNLSPRPSEVTLTGTPASRRRSKGATTNADSRLIFDATAGVRGPVLCLHGLRKSGHHIDVLLGCCERRFLRGEADVRCAVFGHTAGRPDLAFEVAPFSDHNL